MAKLSKKNHLERWEIAILKAMLAKGGYRDQEILAYFTRPDRTINHARIHEIRTGKRHAKAKPAAEVELDRFVAGWPQIDPKTGLHLLGDELLVKPREAMLLAVQAYNNPRTYFRSELFIVVAVIAWTYLLHAHYKRTAIDYRHTRKKQGGETEVVKTAGGAEKYWELGQCLKAPQCPLDEGTKRNLEFLIGIRHEIEHRMTTRIDDALSAKLQACCLNFNRVLKALFGDRYGLDRDMSIALQFSSIGVDQKKLLAAETRLPAHVESIRAAYEDKLADEQYRDPHYAYRVLFVPKVASKKAQADDVLEFVPAGSEEADEINKVYLKETEKQKYKPKTIVKMMQDEGFPKFNMHHHTELWRALDAKKDGKGYGVKLGDGQWYWYDRWLEAVRQHCAENRERYV